MVKIAKEYHKILILLIITISSSFIFPQIVKSQQQPVLERISVTERSDWLGFVVRLHLTAPIDSFNVAQTESHLLQVILYSKSLNMGEFLEPDKSLVTDISQVELQDGIGFELKINDEHSFEVDSYFDMNLRDLLISLTYTNEFHAQDPPIFTSVTDDLNEKEEVKLSGQSDEVIESIVEDIYSDSAMRSSFQRITDLDRLLPDDPFEIYTRSMTSAGSRGSYLLRPSTANANLSHDFHPWMNHSFFGDQQSENIDAAVVLYSPKVFRSHNTELPMGNNDGALWQGRGLNYQFSAGFGAIYGPLTIVFRPSLVMSENREFELSPRPQLRGLSIYAMPLTNSDIPQRFGEDSINRFDLGDSFVELEYKGFAAGFSNQRIWTGPAVYNPLIFSYNAPGFLHTYLGTQSPFEFRYGQLETKWFWGGLRESDYFDEDPTNDLRFVTGLIFAYSPSVIPGLHIGFNRTAFAYYPEGGPGLSNILMALRMSQPDSIDNTEEAFHSMMSFFGRWVFPDIGFEFYAEWGRNDNRRRVRDFIAEPELNRGYVLGFIKNFDLTTSRKLQLLTEITNVENSSVTSQQRKFNTWYEHNVIRQGFTNRGQVLGANIGPGSSTQIMRLSYYEKRGMLGVSAQRVAMQNDRFHRFRETYRNLDPWPQYWFMIDRHMIQMNYGFHALAFLPYGFELQLDYHIAKFDNIDNFWQRDLINNHFMLTMRYNLRSYFSIPN
ncbi:MAG: hypothetical protein EA391_01650 [Balneolaceae bacterium]|nr:MAG: hypothetical protein EA391_01650 [Balneolaceae bacterium]